MARFEPRPGLDVEVARRIGQLFLRRVLDMLQDEAQRRAPDTRIWVTMRDEKVRHTHMQADGQIIPANLRFLIEHPDMPGSNELARRPGDEALSAANRYNCRCAVAVVPHLLRQTIHSTGVRQEGARVSGSVETRFPRAAESENGTSGDQAAHFMVGALREVAARLRQGQRR